MRNNFSQNQKDRRGIILVLTMIIMSILLATAVGFGVFIISDLRQAAQTDAAILAYYAADGGLERSLFFLRKVGSFSGLLSAYSGDESLSNNSFWNISQSQGYESIVFRQRLYGGQSVKLYFLDRRALSGNPKSVLLEWAKEGDNSAKMQAIFTQLNPQTDAENAVVYYTDKEKLLSIPGLVCEKFEDAIVAGNAGNEPPYDYVLELRSLGSAENDFIDNIRVIAYNSDDCSGESNSAAITNITLRSLGGYANARQEIVAQIPPRDPVSGLLGFVLFSEEDITKGY